MYYVWEKICDKLIPTGMCRPQCQEPPQRASNLDPVGKKSHSQPSPDAQISPRTAPEKLVTIAIKTPRSTTGGAKRPQQRHHVGRTSVSVPSDPSSLKQLHFHKKFGKIHQNLEIQQKPLHNQNDV